MLSEIAAYLATNGLGTVGSTIFIGDVPESPDLCTMLFEYAGSPNGLTYDGAAESRPGLQVRVRASSIGYGAGIAHIKAIEDLLHGKSNLTIGAHTYMQIAASGSPAFIGRDSEGRPEWTQNYQIIKEA